MLSAQQRLTYSFTPFGFELAAVTAIALTDASAVVQLLCRHGATVDAPTRQDRLTPLHVAAGLDNRSAAQALLAAGASRDALDAQGRRPIDLARAAGHQEMVRLLESAAVGGSG
jgi:ankyrin repeat protein